MNLTLAEQFGITFAVCAVVIGGLWLGAIVYLLCEDGQ